jgi:hypothetical protein
MGSFSVFRVFRGRFILRVSDRSDDLKVRGLLVSPQTSLAMTTILTLDIKLSGWRAGASSWSARVEVPESFTLSELHGTIQRLVTFDDDHLREFFAGRNWRDRKVTFGEPASPFEINEGEEVPLSEVFPLPKGYKLYYNFDFGDDWMFEITCHPESTQAARKSKRAKLIHEKGRRPVQYLSEDDEG